MFGLFKKKESVVVEEQTQVKKGEKFVGRLTMRKGHTMFEYNVDTCLLVPAKFESTTHFFSGGKNRKIITNKNCQYFSCLNRKNAIRKLTKMGFKVVEPCTPRNSDSPTSTKQEENR